MSTEVTITLTEEEVAGLKHFGSTDSEFNSASYRDMNITGPAVLNKILKAIPREFTEDDLKPGMVLWIENDFRFVREDGEVCDASGCLVTARWTAVDCLNDGTYTLERPS